MKKREMVFYLSLISSVMTVAICVLTWVAKMPVELGLGEVGAIVAITKATMDGLKALK